MFRCGLFKFNTWGTLRCISLLVISFNSNKRTSKSAINEPSILALWNSVFYKTENRRLSLSVCFRISTALFQYHEEHQYPVRGHDRSCRVGPLSCARSFTDSPHHFDSGDYKFWPLVVYHSENPRACYTSPFYAFSICAAICKNTTPAYNESHLYTL
jgi:hypothetical protein